MRGKRRPPEERVSCLAGPLPPCKVCGEDAAGFHYGVNTCEACKGFFRRSLLREREYVCLNSDRCDVETNRRKSCPKCRYLKCLRTGMSKDAIKTGRYTYTKRSNDLEEIRQLVREGKIPLEKIPKSDVLNRRIKLQSQQSSIPPCTGPSRNGGKSHTEECISSAHSSPELSASDDSKGSGERAQECHQSRENGYDIQTLSSGGQVRFINLNHKTNDNPPSRPNSVREPETDTLDSLYPDERCSQSELPAAEDKSEINSAEISENIAEGSRGKFRELGPSSPLLSLLDSDTTLAGYDLHCDDIPVNKSSDISMTTRHGNRTVEFDFTLRELDEAINFVKNLHRKHVRDFIDEPEDVLQSRLDKCLLDCKLKEKIFGEMRTMERRDYDMVFRSTGIDVDGRLFILTECISHVEEEVKVLVALCKALPEFRRLEMLTQLALLKGSFVVLLIIGYYKGYDSKSRMLLSRYRSFCSHDVAMWGEKHQKMMDILFEVADELKAWSMTYAMHVCLKMVILFNPDSVTGNDKRNVERISMKYHECLKLLLRRAHPYKANQQLDKGIRELTSMLHYASSYHFQHVRDMDILSYKPVSENKMYLELLDL